MNIVNWGIIGCGNVTEKKSGPALQKINNSNLVAVMRRNAELAKDYAKRHHVPKWYDNADSLILDSQINAIYIATPPSTHMKYALEAIKARKPVYIEKPMGLTYKDCKKVLDASKEYDIPVYVAYYRRALPYFIKIKNLIENDAIGKLRGVTINQLRKRTPIDQNNIPWRLIPEVSGGGLFHDLGCHTLDILDMLIGPIASAKGHHQNQSNISNADDTVVASFKFQNGVLGTGLWCFDASENYECNEIIGTKGKITFTTFSFEPIQLHTPTGIEYFTTQQPEHIQQPLITTIVEELLGNGTALSTGETAIRTAKIMDDICSIQL